MRKFVKPAHERASIPDPSRRRDLPAEGLPVAWNAYWAGKALRGDVVVYDLAEDGETPVIPVEAEAAPEAAPVPAPDAGA